MRVSNMALRWILGVRRRLGPLFTSSRYERRSTGGGATFGRRKRTVINEPP
jgi:hypothetical protein